MSTCEEIQPAISRYLDGELPDADDSAVFAHAASCAGCREFLRTSLALRSTLQSEPVPAVPARLDRRILTLRPRSLRTPGAETVRRWWTARLPLPVPAIAAAMVVLLAVSVLLVRSLTTPTSPTQTGQAEYILTLETVEVRGAPADPGSNGTRF
jgi:anti-sigma factor RsiW